MALRVSVCSLLLRGPVTEGGADKLIVRVASDPSRPLGRPNGVPVNGRLVGRVAASGRVIAQLGPASEVSRPRTAAFILAPVRFEGAVERVLGLADPRPEGRFGAGAVALAQQAADQIGQVLGLGEEYRRLEALSLTDTLTGLYNRRFLERALPAELSRARRAGHPLGWRCWI